MKQDPYQTNIFYVLVSESKYEYLGLGWSGS